MATIESYRVFSSISDSEATRADDPLGETYGICSVIRSHKRLTQPATASIIASICGPAWTNKSPRIWVALAAFLLCSLGPLGVNDFEVFDTA